MKQNEVVATGALKALALFESWEENDGSVDKLREVTG